MGESERCPAAGCGRSHPAGPAWRHRHALIHHGLVMVLGFFERGGGGGAIVKFAIIFCLALKKHHTLYMTRSPRPGRGFGKVYFVFFSSWAILTFLQTYASTGECQAVTAEQRNAVNLDIQVKTSYL